MTSGAPEVAVVTTSYPRHAGDFAGHFVASLAEALSRAGASVTVHAPHGPGLAAEETMRGVRVKRFRYLPESLERVAYGDGIPVNIKRDPVALLGLPAFLLALWRLGGRLRREADVVHVQWAPTAALTSRRAEKPKTVVTLHGSDVALALSGGVWGDLMRRALRTTDAVIAVSAELAGKVRCVPGLATHGVAVVPTGVERELCDRPRLVRPDGPVRVAFVGRLLETKGVFELARAFAALPGDATLTIAGAGPAEDELRVLLRELGAEARVSWAGPVPHAKALEVMADADLVVVPSHAEGCGLVAIEAAALGTPVVGTRVGVLPDLLENDEVLVPPRDAEALAAALRRVVEDADLRARLGVELRARVAERYTWDVLATRVLDVYRRVLAGPGATAEVAE